MQVDDAPKVSISVVTVAPSALEEAVTVAVVGLAVASTVPVSSSVAVLSVATVPGPVL